MSVVLTGMAETPLPRDAARLVSALMDWMDHEDIDVRVICEACHRLGHPEPVVKAEVLDDGAFALTCPHRRLVYRGPDPRTPAH